MTKEQSKLAEKHGTFRHWRCTDCKADEFTDEELSKCECGGRFELFDPAEPDVIERRMQTRGHF